MVLELLPGWVIEPCVRCGVESAYKKGITDRDVSGLCINCTYGGAF